jgi:hypothetical protein
MPWAGPEFEGDFPTLGWAVIQLMEAYLDVPDGPNAGERIVVSDDQARFIARWYEVDPDSGRFVYRRGTYRRAKGAGKSPILAGLAHMEMWGPVVFDGWDARGRPVGRPRVSPMVQMAATAEDQVQNTFGPAYEMVRHSPACEDFRLDPGITRIGFKDRPGRIDSITAEARSKEGARPTFAVADETHLWLKGNGGVRLFEVLLRNAAKVQGRVIETTNAFVPGERSVAEATFDAWMAGAPGILYDSVEAPDVPDLADHAAVLAALRMAYAGSPWVDLERLVQEIADPSTTPGMTRRFYFNQCRAPEDDVTQAERWAELYRADAKLVPGDIIALGFDGSDSGDGTALWACKWPDWAVHRIGYWEPPSGAAKGSWRVPRAEVDAVMRAAMEDYRVVRCLYDPPFWRTEFDQWSAEWPDVFFGWSTASAQRIGPASERWAAMVEEGTLGHDGDRVLAEHLSHARRELVGTGGWWRPAKKGQGRIDAVVAAINSVEALGQAVAKELIPDGRPKGWFAFAAI